MNLFLYTLMNHMTIWDGTKVFFWSVPINTTIDITATSNSKLFSMDTNDDKDHNYQLSMTDYLKK